jgi:hypothetical protein
MPTTFQKRQMEMKRQEKQKLKLQRRAEKKNAEGDTPADQEELQVLSAPRILEEFMDLPNDPPHKR